MRPRTILTVSLLAFVGAGLVILVATEVPWGGAAAEPETSPSPSDGVVAYYFHRTRRCPTCKRIERLGREVVADVAGDRARFTPVNVDIRGNGRYVREFELVSSSLVLAAYEDGERTRWKNLQKVWEYVGDPEQFRDYVREEVVTFLRAGR